MPCSEEAPDIAALVEIGIMSSPSGFATVRPDWRLSGPGTAVQGGCTYVWPRASWDEARILRASSGWPKGPSGCCQCWSVNDCGSQEGIPAG